MSYSFDAYGKMIAFSVLDQESYESVYIRYDEEMGAWIDSHYQVIEDLEQAASELGIDLTREAPVKIQETDDKLHHVRNPES